MEIMRMRRIVNNWHFFQQSKLEFIKEDKIVLFRESHRQEAVSQSASYWEKAIWLEFFLYFEYCGNNGISTPCKSHGVLPLNVWTKEWSSLFITLNMWGKYCIVIREIVDNLSLTSMFNYGAFFVLGVLRLNLKRQQNLTFSIS